MASNYTQHVQLPLWEPDDDFLREEFNEANQKLDIALGNSPIARLGHLELDGTATTMNFDLSMISLNKFSMLILTGATIGGSTHLCINGDKTSNQYIYVRYFGNSYETSKSSNLRLFDGSDTAFGGGGRMLLTPMGGNVVGSESFSNGSYSERILGCYLGCGFTDIQSLTIECKAGTVGELHLYGLRK